MKLNCDEISDFYIKSEIKYIINSFFLEGKTSCLLSQETLDKIKEDIDNIDDVSDYQELVEYLLVTSISTIRDNNFICNFEKTKELLCDDYNDAFKIAEEYEKQQQEKNKNILSGEEVKKFIKKYDDNKVVLLKSNSDYDNDSNYYAFSYDISFKEFLKIVKNKDLFSGLKIFNKKQIIEEECIDENKYPKEQVENNYKDFNIVNFVRS